MSPYYEMLYRELIDFEKDLAGIISREDVINIESADIMAAMGAAYCRRKETY